MSQPVVDTLQRSDAFRKTGMEPDQAKGMARAPGEQLGEHVAATGDLQSEFRQVSSDLRAEIQQLRCDLEAQLQAVDDKLDLLRAELSAKIDRLNWKLTFLVGGFGLLLSVLTVVSGMGFFDRAPPASHSVSENRPL